MDETRCKLGRGVTWADDWFAIEPIALGIAAIGEPLYHQLNWNYLIEGTSQALLLDTGPGECDISKLVRTLTDKPVSALASHMHYDHTGNMHRFERRLVADLPMLRDCVANSGNLIVPDILHLGSYEDRAWIPFRVSEWIASGSTIELEGRPLDVIAAPGHAVDHIALFDRTANILFAADFLYPGELYAQTPGADLEAYLASSRKLADIINSDTQILGAHGQQDEQGAHAAPRLTRQDLLDLITALENLKRSGAMPERTVVNDRMVLLASPMAYSAWQTR